MSATSSSSSTTNFKAASLPSSTESFVEINTEDYAASDASSGAPYPPSSNSSTALPISSPPESFNSLDLLDDDSDSFSCADSSSIGGDLDWRDVPTRQDAPFVMEELEEDTSSTVTPSYTYAYPTELSHAKTIPSESTVRPRRRRYTSTTSKSTFVPSPHHDPVMWPLTKDMFVIVVICVVIACLLVMVARPFTVAWAVNEGYYD